MLNALRSCSEIARGEAAALENAAQPRARACALRTGFPFLSIRFAIRFFPNSLLCFILSVCLACSPSPTRPPSSSSPTATFPVTANAPAPLLPTRIPTADATAPPTRALTLAPRPTPHLVINPRQPMQIIVVSVGQVIAFTRPLDVAEWQVDYDAASLSPLMSPETMRTPDAQGWLFRAVAAGQSDLTFTSIASCPAPPCPPTVARFVVTIHVQP